LDKSLTFLQLGQELGRTEEAARKIWVRAMESLRQAWASAP
jgi:DNA-directed RNA polymerase sigma subunit (sigma70/sigma32)